MPRKLALMLAGTLAGIVAALAFALAMPARLRLPDPQLDSVQPLPFGGLALSLASPQPSRSIIVAVPRPPPQHISCMP